MYTADSDPLCYKGTNVLKNKAGLRDQASLDEFETSMALTRWEEPWPAGEIDAAYYCRLHHHLFQDVYEWAGRYRRIRTGKGNIWFCYPEYIDQEMDKLFAPHSGGIPFTQLSLDLFAVHVAQFLGSLNAIHPFRDGNGRTQMAILIMLCESSNFSVNLKPLQPERVMGAMIESFSSKPKKLTRLIAEVIA
jgi:cell filamentation protein, protein adenylyltransferase